MKVYNHREIIKSLIFLVLMEMGDFSFGVAFLLESRAGNRMRWINRRAKIKVENSFLAQSFRGFVT